VEGSEFVVSRVANIDNSSKYLVDGKTKTRSDVEELLMSKGIDLENNRFLILQGEVEQIATMKPKGATEHDTGLLEYLEDVIGSNRFAEQITEKGTQVRARPVPCLAASFQPGATLSQCDDFAAAAYAGGGTE
jgi:structural maintenance of chromosome 4